MKVKFLPSDLVKFKGDGYGGDKKADPDVTKLRQVREDFWIKQRLNRKRVLGRAANSITSAKELFLKINMWYKDDIKNTFNKIGLTLNQLSKKILKLIASEILDNSQKIFEAKKGKAYLYILVIIDTKLLSVETTSQQSKISAPKTVCVVHFVNKGIDQLHLYIKYLNLMKLVISFQKYYNIQTTYPL